MDDSLIKRIEADPNFVKLVAERRSLGLTLSIAMIVIYFGFILLVAFAPGFLATPLIGGDDDRHPHRHSRHSFGLRSHGFLCQPR